MNNGLNRNLTGIPISDFYVVFNLNGVNFYLPKEAKGLFASTILDSANEHKILIPSLGEIVDCANESESSAVNLRNYLENKEIITSTKVKAKDQDYFFFDDNKKLGNLYGLSTQLRRANLNGNMKKNGWINVYDKEKLMTENENWLESVFNRPYDKIVSGLDKIVPDLEKVFKIPGPLHFAYNVCIAKHEGKLKITKHDICCGEFRIF